MVTAKESQTFQQFSAWKSPRLPHMALLQLEKNSSLPCFPPTTFTANLTFPGQYTSGLRGSEKVQQDAVFGSLKPLPKHGDISCPNDYLFSKDSQFTSPQKPRDIKNPIDNSFTTQKRLLIFDQSGNHTRMFFTPCFPQNQFVPSNTLSNGNGLIEKIVAPEDQQFLANSVVDDKWVDNDLSDGEGEMHEDTDEIDALLYSDSDDEYDDDMDGENDEVTSTGHTPCSIHEDYNKDNVHEEGLAEEVASSDDSPKRQRLLNGMYKKSSYVSFGSPSKQGNSSSYDDDAESSCADITRNDCDSKREEKVKIRDVLKILESIIPGLKNEDPFTIIDQAINYLKSMRTEAEALGLGYPESESATLS